MKTIKPFIALILTISFVGFSCDPKDPEPENEEEIITDVTLTFTPAAGGTPITASAQDPDGEGPNSIEVSGPIDLAEGTSYVLTITVDNSIAGESITDEIAEEDDEHMFFFGWTGDVFASPTGNGNIDNRTDPVNYVDFDANQDPVGLETNWTTGTPSSGTFRIILKHQPNIKSATTTSSDGETDLDLTWDINILS